MLVEFARPVEQQHAGRALRFHAGERRDLSEVVARSLVGAGIAAAIEPPPAPAEEAPPRRGRAKGR